MPLPTVISDISPIVGTGAAPNAGQPGGGENPSTFDDYLRLYAAFIAQLRAGGGLAASGANRVPFFDGTGALTSAADFVWDAGGNVGIGTATPGSRLEISTNNAAALYINKPTPSQSPSYIQCTADLSNLTLQAGSSAGFFSAVEVMGWNGTGNPPRVALYTAGAERMRIDASGNVGIGTTTSLSPLHVFRASSSSVRIDTDAAASTTQLNFAVSGTNRWSLYRPGGSNDLRILDNTNTIDVVTWQAGGQQINNANSVVPPTLTVNGQWNLTPTSNTNMRISYRGTDGVTRVANITLA